MSRWFPTSGRGRALLLVGLVLLVGGAVWWRTKGGNSEPQYGGLPLSCWLNQGREHITNGSRAMPFRLNAESTAAVRAIGTNAFPKLREWMTAPQKGWRTRAYTWAQKNSLPSALHEAVTSLAGYDHYDPLRSALAFQALGRDAIGAVPFLIEMLEQEGSVGGAVMGLCLIQPEGVNALIETFPKIGDDYLRANIVSVLQLSVTQEIEPACASFVAKWVVDDPHPVVRMAAARSLGMFNNSAAVAVPVLTKALMDRDSNVRSIAWKSLGRFGQEAASAAVSLRSALNDSNPQVRADAARALQAIGAPPVE